MSDYSAPHYAPLTPLPVDTIPVMWRAVVEAYADRVMLRCNGVSFTYRDIDQRSAALARGLLSEGAGKGSRIGILAPNGAEWVVAWLAANRIGALAVGLSTMFSAPELAYAIRHADISILISADRYLRHDYVSRLGEAFPELVDRETSKPLALMQAPFLRSVWFTAETDRRWSRGSLAQLETQGQNSEVFGADLLAEAEREIAACDLAVMIYTSGSTAFPKGVLHTHANVVRKPAFNASDKGMVPFDVRPDDRMIVPMPFFWAGGLLSLLGTMLCGARLICVEDGSPEDLLQAIREEEATQLAVSELKLAAVQDAPSYRRGDFDRLRPHNNNQFAFFLDNPSLRKRVPVAFGMTETLGPHTGDITGALLPPEAEGSFCKALPGMELKIVDPETGATLLPGEVGELCVRGVFMMDGMYKKERSEVFDADGYYHTGDGCSLSADGYLYFDSRLSGMIKTSGANVSPEEVEMALIAFDDVIDAAVMGVPDPKAGQLVVAAVVRKAGSNVTEQEVRERLKTQVSSFKVPKSVFFFEFDELPRTPSNKIRKPPLAEKIAKMMSEQA